MDRISLRVRLMDAAHYGGYDDELKYPFYDYFLKATHSHGSTENFLFRKAICIPEDFFAPPP